MNTYLSIAACLAGCIALWRTLRMSVSERREFDQFLAEHQEKLGEAPGLRARFLSWNAAKGGRAPKWHWIPPVRSTGH